VTERKVENWVQIGMRFIVVFTLVFAITACGSQKSPTAPSQRPRPKPSAADVYANGRSIFMTGRDLAGARISASPRPLRPSCMACHHVDGSGGVHLPGGAVSADLRHKALVNAQHTPYTTTLLERAISTGVDNEGEKLNPLMPRWQMSKTDLHDVALYVYNRLK